MEKNKIPNNDMLNLMLEDSYNVQSRFPDEERMPKGYICPGYDIRLMQPLAVLKYIFGIETQWSCQGTHKDYIGDAYILLAPEENFPDDLVNLIVNTGLQCYLVKDYDLNLRDTGKMRVKISSGFASEVSTTELKELNEKFLTILDSWSAEKIREHRNQII